LETEGTKLQRVPNGGITRVPFLHPRQTCKW